MLSKNKRVEYLDIFRFFLVISVLLYHLNILKGGYLAVCAFFVLSGYLSCISASLKEKFSFKDYYVDKFKKLYLPLIIVVFLTITITSLIPSLEWINMKQETKSILLGYNNFWQLNTNLDYFARQVNSPFIHLWYIAILIQFDLLFPFIYVLLKKVGEKTNKNIPIIITTIASIVSTAYFYKTSLSSNTMFTYYNTFARIFSLLFGMLLAYIHINYKEFINSKIKGKIKNRIIYFFYLITITVLIITISPSSKYFAISMILTSLISCRIIENANKIEKKKNNIVDKALKYLSTISYEIYLVQYPIIYIFNIYTFKYSIISTIILTFIISMIIHFIITKKKKLLSKIVVIILRILLTASILFGIYKFIIAEDYTKEMKRLEEQLALNEEMMLERQNEYQKLNEKRENEILNSLASLENDEEKIKQFLIEAPVTGVGDSVMLGAIGKLYQKFPNGYFDAKISRTAWVANGILKDLKAQNKVGEIVILNLGANGDCPENCKTEIMKTLSDSQVFWLNVTNDRDVKVNKKLEDFASKYENLHIIDWATISKGHSEYFVADGIHLTNIGQDAYVETIYNEIYKVYSKKIVEQKEEILKQREEEIKNKTTFYGNTLLLNAFDTLSEKYKEDRFVIDKEYTYQSLKQEIEKEKNEDTLTNKLFFVFDNSLNITEEEFEELIDLCKEKEIYIITANIDVLNKDKLENTNYYDFTNEFEDNLLQNQTQLSEDGIKILTQKIIEMTN